MALFNRQVLDPGVYDDQSPTLLGLFVGNWTRYPREGFNNNTLTATLTPGASLSFTFTGAWAIALVASGGTNSIMETGSQARLYGALVEQSFGYPIAEYKIDGFSGKSPERRCSLRRLPNSALQPDPNNQSLTPPRE